MTKYCLVFDNRVLIRTEVMTLLKETKTQITCKNVEGFTYRFFKDTGYEVGRKKINFKYSFTQTGIEREIVSYEVSVVRYNEMVTENKKEIENIIKILMDKSKDIRCELEEALSLLSSLELKTLDSEIIDLQSRKKRLDKQ